MEGRRKREEGRGKKEEGRRKREEGRRKKEEGRRKKHDIAFHLISSDSLKPKTWFFVPWEVRGASRTSFPIIIFVKW